MPEIPVTVLMAVYNGQDFVAEAVESVLGQTFSDFELLVVDDASTDGTPHVLARLTDRRVRTIRNPRNVGLTRSLNNGIAVARGEFIARLDADDTASPGRLERQLAFLRAHPDYVALGCWYSTRPETGAGGLHQWPVDDLSICWRLLFDTALPHPGLTMRARAVRAVGGYDGSLPYTQDYDLECRLSRVGRLYNLPEVLVCRHRHPGQISVQRRAEQERIRTQISCREMALLLRDETVDPRLCARANVILRRGELPPPAEARAALAFALKVAREFAEAHRCPGFVSGELEWILKEHAKSAVLDLLHGPSAQVVLRAWVAAQLAGSGLVDRPLRVLARSAVRRAAEALFPCMRGAGTREPLGG